MKKSYLEPELEIVKFSFSDSILNLTESKTDNGNDIEESVGEDVGDGD